MDKKELLFQAALKLFVSQGFNATPTSMIAKEAGVATGTLFYFFPKKDDLIVALYLKLKGMAQEKIHSALGKAQSLKDVIKIYYTESLVWSLTHQEEFSFLAQFANSPYSKKIEDDAVPAQAEPVLEIFRKGIESREIVGLDVHLLYSLISNQVFGVNQYLSAHKMRKKTQTQIIGDTFDLFWKMISRP